MSRLLLLRHARAAWAEPGMRDFDRPLDPSGRIDADALGEAMRTAGHVPVRVVCSAAKRARETWEAVARHLPPLTDVIVTDHLYTTDATGYLNLVREAGTAETLLIVGHNPMIEDVCFALAPDGDPAAAHARSGGFPTSGLAVIDFDGPLGDALPAAGRLDAFLTPGGH